jgi:hypothetical protein
MRREWRGRLYLSPQQRPARRARLPLRSVPAQLITLSGSAISPGRGTSLSSDVRPMPKSGSTPRRQDPLGPMIRSWGRASSGVAGVAPGGGPQSEAVSSLGEPAGPRSTAACAVAAQPAAASPTSEALSAGLYGNDGRTAAAAQTATSTPERAPPQATRPETWDETPDEPSKAPTAERQGRLRPGPAQSRTCRRS